MQIRRVHFLITALVSFGAGCFQEQELMSSGEAMSDPVVESPSLQGFNKGMDVVLRDVDSGHGRDGLMVGDEPSGLFQS